MRINYNLSAQLANVSLKRADAKMTASLQQLSSGYKINKAADDSAGMAISNKMRSQIRALEQASRNADDGTSIIRTAEGALSEIEAMLQRTRELSVQAANDTYTVDDRYSIQKEIDELLDEVDRIASTTDFNGTNLLDGTCTRVVTFDEMGMGSLGVSSSVLSGTYQITVDDMPTAATGTLTYSIPPAGAVNTVKINDTTISIQATDTMDSVYENILDVCDMMGIDVSRNGGALTMTSRAVGSDQSFTLRSVGATNDSFYQGKDASVTLTVGGTSQFTGRESVACNGNNITITDNSGFEMKLSLEPSETANKDAIQAGDVRNITVYDTGSMKMQIGANEHQNIDIDFPVVSCRSLMLREDDGDNMVNVCSQAGASKAITAFDNAIRMISDYRSDLGAMENRLNSTISSLDVSVENITDAMSRIKDTDMAEAMTYYTQESVLSQAATAMLTQANNRPQQVMSLLQG